jgi:NAD(P)-dependent dehydrogenase (short-subunit alcohol dehydrogenase family)
MPEVEVVASDAGDSAATKMLIDQVQAKHGRIDVLFVNAGIARMAPSSTVNEAFFDALFNVNVRGPYFLLKHAAPLISDGGSLFRA